MSGRDWVVSGSGRVGVGWGRGRSGRSGYDFCSLVQSKMVVMARVVSILLSASRHLLTTWRAFFGLITSPTQPVPPFNQPTNPSTSEAFNQQSLQPKKPSTNEAFNQSSLQPTKPSTNQLLNHPTLESTNPSTNQPFNQRGLQPTKPSTKETFNQRSAQPTPTRPNQTKGLIQPAPNSKPRRPQTSPTRPNKLPHQLSQSTARKTWSNKPLARPPKI